MKTKLCLSTVFLLLLVPWGGRAAERGSEGTGEIDRLARETSDLKLRLQNVRLETLNFDPDERFLDAKISMDMQHWDEGASYLYSLLETESFRADPRYYEAMMMLGRCMFEMKNTDGARFYYEELLKAQYKVGEALIFLVDIAADMDRKDDLVRYADLARRMEAQGSDRLLYAHGKAEYLIGNLPQAYGILAGVPATSDYWNRSRYFMAVILTSQKKYAEASALFEDIADKADRKKEGELVEKANLSVARLAYETGELSRSADFYQRISRQAPEFKRALFEITHLHIKAAAMTENEDEKRASYNKALEALDILSGYQDLSGKMTIDTSILRGQINFLLGTMNYAKDAYKAVVDRFAPMSAELWEFSKDPDLIDQWFVTLLDSPNNPVLKRQLLSEEAAAWVKEEPALGQVVALLQDIAQQKAYMNESEDNLAKLNAALTQANPRDLFPQLKNVWISTVEVENSLMMLYEDMLESQKKDFGFMVTGLEAEQVKKLDATRIDLSRKLERAPRTVMAIQARDKVLQRDARRLERELDEVLLTLQKYKNQVDAMMSVLREVKYKGSFNLKVNDEEGIKAELNREMENLAKLYDDALNTKLNIQKEMIIGSGLAKDELNEAGLRALLWTTMQNQSSVIDDVARKSGLAGGSSFDRRQKLQKDVLLMLAELEKIRREVDEKAELKAQYYREFLKEETKNLAINRAQTEAVERKAYQLARDTGKPLFIGANERLGRVVLEADLGLVDLAWRRKQERTDERETLAEEQGGVLSFLRKELSAVKEEVE